MLEYLSSELTVFLELRSGKTVHFSEKDARKGWLKDIWEMEAPNDGLLEQICPRTNIRAYFRAKWVLLFIYTKLSQKRPKKCKYMLNFGTRAY